MYLVVPPPKRSDDLLDVGLDGAVYRIRYRWNERAGAWHMDLFDLDDDPIRLGMRLVLHELLLRDLVHPQRPPGDFVVSAHHGGDPGLNDLGERVTLFYIETGTTEETIFGP